MNKFEIFVSSDFGEYKNEILYASENICQKLVQIIEVEDFQISIKPFSSDNPYLKISAAADEPHIIWLKLNTSYHDFKEIIDKYLAEGITHEFHHIARMDSKKDWNFLELLVMEGLAIHFVMKVLNTKRSLNANDISDEEINNLKGKIIADLYDENFNIRFWQKREKKQNNVPNSFIYRLGYRIVEEYLRDHPAKNAVKLYKEPAKSFLPEYLSQKY